MLDLDAASWLIMAIEATRTSEAAIKAAGRESCHMTQSTYGVAELAKLSGLTERTLRYYDQIGLLVPKRADNGYRMYDSSDVRKLQHIMVLRSCGMELSDISTILSGTNADLSAYLKEHISRLERQRHEITCTIAASRDMLGRLERMRGMDDEEMFEQLKRDSVVRFEEEYGEEARSRYGDEAIDSANERMLSMSKKAWDMKEELERRIKDQLIVAMQTGDPTSPEAVMLAEMHAQWIRVHWGEDAYTPEAHVQLAKGYLKDPRFIEYYDGPCGEGATKFLYEAIKDHV